MVAQTRKVAAAGHRAAERINDETQRAAGRATAETLDAAARVIEAELAEPPSELTSSQISGVAAQMMALAGADGDAGDLN